MRRGALVLLAMFVACAAVVVDAQNGPDTLSPLAAAVGCAPPPSLDDTPAHALRVLGSQDSIQRHLFGDHDLLVVSGGSGAGVQLGQQFFIRRTITFGGKRNSRGIKTLGWVRVVAVNESTAIALVDHVCGGITVDDYLDRFVAPDVSAAIESDEAPGQPDFTSLGHVIVGNEDREMVGAGDFVLVDWGTTQGLRAGSRFAIYRDIGIKGLPLSGVGEGVVISASSKVALTRVTRARDAVYSGDYIAVRR